MDYVKQKVSMNSCTDFGMIASVPGASFYNAVLSVMDYAEGLSYPNIDPQECLTLQARQCGWKKHDVLLVTSLRTLLFMVLTDGVTVIQDGTLSGILARAMLRYMKKHQLDQQQVTVNVQGIFSEECFPARQLPLRFDIFSSDIDDCDYIKEAKRILLINEKLKAIDLDNSKNPPRSVEAVALRYERDAELVNILKEIRGNSCQLCGYTFLTTTGDYYSECHHLEALANGGLNVSCNLLVVCANCHRRLHLADTRILEHTEKHVKLSIDGEIYRCEF